MAVMLMRSMVMVMGDNKELLAKEKVVIMVLLNLDDHKGHDDHDTDEGLDASSNGGTRRGWKRTFASPLNSIGDHYMNYYRFSTVMIFIVVHLNKKTNFIF